MMSFQVHVLTLFPCMFPGPLSHSLAGKALADGKWNLKTLDMHCFAQGKHRTVDDAPFGGGPGMVMRPDVIDIALQAANRMPNMPFVYLTPRGRRLTQTKVQALARSRGLVILCGRFEGVDQRVLDTYGADELSIGDYILSGGEPAAIVLIDALVRLLPGVVGQEESLLEESFERGLLEYPHYTRPQIWAGRAVPQVLVSGHHQRVAAWRQAQAEEVTRERRPDLWLRYMAATSNKQEGKSDNEYY